jgi:hypothetical protein
MIKLFSLFRNIIKENIEGDGGKEKGRTFYIKPQYIMDAKLQMFLSIMAFYVILSYILFPLGFYYLVEKSLVSAGNGFIVGSVISIGLWLTVGKNMIKK